MLVLHEPVHWYSFAGAICIVMGVLLTQQGRRTDSATSTSPACAQELPGNGADSCAQPEAPTEHSKLLVSSLSNVPDSSHAANGKLSAAGE